MSIKLVDSAVPMNESGYPVARAKHIWFDDNATLQDKLDNKELGGGDNSTTLTQEEYEALPEEERLNGLYYTYDTKRIYKNGVQYGASEPIPLTMEEYKALKAAGAIDEKQDYLVEADAEGILLGAEDIGYNNAESGIEATTVQGAIDKVSEKVDSKTEINDTSSSATSTYSSAKINELNANRQVKTFDNSGSSAEKWCKICSAITGGIGCNIKLTASRADSTATVQYFSALFRDSRYRYTSSYISKERTVYESELVAEYSAYIIADANNDIWVHVPSYGKAIIEIDTRAITIDGTAGTPVKDYVYSSFESQTTKDKFDRINIKQFNQPGGNTSFKYVTITSTGSGLGGLELNVPYAGKYMFSTPKSEPVYFGSSAHKGYTLNGWAWSDDGKTLHLRVAGFAPFSISVLGSVSKDISPNNVATISDMTSTAPEGVDFVSSPVYSNATTNDIGIKQVFYATSTSYPAIFTIHSKSTTGVFWFRHTRVDHYGLKSVEGYYDIKNSNIIILNRVGADLEVPLACSVYANEDAKEYGVKITALWQYEEGHVAITEAKPVTAIPYKITY